MGKHGVVGIFCLDVLGHIQSGSQLIPLGSPASFPRLAELGTECYPGGARPLGVQGGHGKEGGSADCRGI